LSSVYPPLECRDAKRAIETLGFESHPKNGTSHEHRIKGENGRRYKVTVDCPKAPYKVTAT